VGRRMQRTVRSVIEDSCIVGRTCQRRGADGRPWGASAGGKAGRDECWRPAVSGLVQHLIQRRLLTAPGAVQPPFRGVDERELLGV